MGDAKSCGAFWDTYWTQNFARARGINQCQVGNPDNPPNPPDNPDDTPDMPNTRLTNLFLGEGCSLDTYSDGNNQPSMGPTGNFTGQMWKLTMLRRIGNLLSSANIEARL